MADISNIRVLPVGTPTLDLVGYGVRLSFVVAKDSKTHQFVVGLVKSRADIIHLAYAMSMDHGLKVLMGIFSGFLSLGFKAESGEIGVK